MIQSGRIEGAVVTGLRTRQALCQRSLYRDYFKRILDILICVLLAPGIVPVIFVLAFIARKDGHSGVFAHRRIGQNGQCFPCYKIRTMGANAEQELADLLMQNNTRRAEWLAHRKLDPDPRVTRLGRLLRRTGLDELPQIWNVLKGDMSLIGPRPVPEDELSKYGARREVYLAMRPGITGLWQVSGRNDISYAQRVNLDEAYFRNLSFTGDVKIAWRTFKLMLSPNGR